MTDRALEAALLPCPFCGSHAFSREDHNHSTGWEIDCGQDGEHRCEIRPSVWARNKAEAIAAWNRRAPLSALPGEAEVVGWAYSGPRGGLIVTEEKPEHAPEAVQLVTLASLQAMQARAEKVERERDGALTANASLSRLLDDLDPQMTASKLQAAEARVKELEEALEPLLTAAVGLSHGQDWNKGTQALAHGYRQQLLDVIPTARAAIRSLGDHHDR